jgi:GAF domain-containing protein
VQSLTANNPGTVGQAERRKARLQALSLVTRAFAGPLDMRGIAQAVHNALDPVLGAPIWFLGRYDQARQSVEVVWQMHAGVELPGGSFPLGNGFTSRVIRSRQSLLIGSWSTEGPPVQLQYAADKPGLPESSITAPILLGHEVLGVISVQDYRSMAFDQDDLTLLQESASMAAHALRADRAAPVAKSGAECREQSLQADSGNNSDAIIVVDCRGQVVGLNQAARALFCGEGKSIILGQPLDSQQAGPASLAEPRVAEKVASIVALLRTGRTPPDVELMSGNGERRRVSICAKPARRDGRPAGGLILFHEVEGSRRGRWREREQTCQ